MFLFLHYFRCRRERAVHPVALVVTSLFVFLTTFLKLLFNYFSACKPDMLYPMDMDTTPQESSSTRRIYSRNQLLAVRTKGTTDNAYVNSIPKELRRPYRGCRAGAKVKARVLAKRWKYKPSIPLCVIGNVNSLTNKTDELESLVRNVKLYRECSLMVLTETWLNNNTLDANIELPGFSHVRADRDRSLSGKSKGGGLVLYINNRWCNPGNVTVKDIICCPDVELVAVSLRPYYLPREFTNAIIVCVYIQRRAKAENACDVIHSTIARLQAQHPDAFIAISGDFNHVTLDSTLPAFYQFVNCPTRQSRTIDLLYANIKDAYTATALPPLGKSDHNLVSLQPLYTPRVRREPITTHTFRMYSLPNSSGCFNILWSPASSSMRWCAGEEALRRGMPGDWIGW
ncbi:uncharacterized protein LOC133978042 [Scomber scombrus]|uniref:uncharacterized protein LOC133978042 n=1 Tax=Scomber scombrus TaxID=13677 RepID=UPI002DDC5D12|nr:uncharacterized protein LOC133978042 [Scomber scombrus]